MTPLPAHLLTCLPHWLPLQAGFEIVEVDGVRLRGMTHDSAARQLAYAFRSEKPTIELVVIPT